jgi:peptidoglycan/LPS O-acetylase OafA/YrhL
MRAYPLADLATSADPSGGTGGVYNPGTGSAPSNLVGQVRLLMDIVAWGATCACVVGIAIVAAMMAISHHRGTGSQHFASLGYVMAACILIGTAGPIVQFLI